MKPVTIKFGMDEWAAIRVVDCDPEGVPCTPCVVVSHSDSPDDWVLSSDEAGEFGDALKAAAASAARTFFRRRED
jgi:hypothetical protein